MSKKKDNSSWKGRGEAYKNAKRAPIINEEEKHPKKKKKKKNKRSEHKHEYIPAIYYYHYISPHSGKKSVRVQCGTHCRKCGRIKGMLFMFVNMEDRIERFKKENPNYVEITLPDSWDYFKDKYIPV